MKRDEIVRDTQYIPVDRNNRIALHNIRKAGAEQLSVLFLCHGITYSSKPVYDTPIDGHSFAERLAMLDFDVFMVDYLGYGYSQYEANITVNLDSAVRDVILALERALQLTDYGSRAAILGWSWGAHVAARVAAAKTELVNALILYGCKSVIRRKDIRGTIINNRRINDKEHVESDFTSPQTLNRKCVDMYVRRCLEIDKTSPLGPRQEVLENDIVLNPEALDLPVLFVYGHKDDIDPRENMDHFFRIKSPEKEYTVLPGAHPVHLENNCNKLVNVIHAFLRNYSGEQ